MNPEATSIELHPQSRADSHTKPLSISERRKLVATLVEAGHLLPEIVKATGATGTKVRNDLRVLGVDISAVSTRSDRLEKNRDAILPFAKSGMTLREIAGSLGLSEGQVQLVSERYQIEITKAPFKYEQHGNSQSYNSGCRCMPCREFNTRRRLDYKARILDGPIPEAVHGTPTGYTNWACRCDRCKAAGSARNAANYFRGRTRTKTRTRWTDEEDRMVLSYSLSASQLAEKLGKTTAAVYQRRTTLRKAGHEMRS